MFLLVPAHPGFPGQIPQSRKTVVCVCVFLFIRYCLQCFDAAGWVGWHEGHLACKMSGGCWHGYLSGARCTFAYGPADPTAIHCLLLREIQIGFGFTFLVPAQWVVPDKIQRAIKQL